MQFACKAIFAGLLLLAGAGQAFAQQVPAPIWSGFYVGWYGGSVKGSSSGTLSHNDPTTPGVTADTMFGTGVNQTFSPTARLLLRRV
jgi:hypothetical protein